MRVASGSWEVARRLQGAVDEADAPIYAIDQYSYRTGLKGEVLLAVGASNLDAALGVVRQAVAREPGRSKLAIFVRRGPVGTVLERLGSSTGGRGGSRP